jgi:branched-subunit amino acid transport protein
MSFESPTIWWVILGIAAGTFLLRVSFVLLFGRLPIPIPLQRVLRFVPAAVLSALIVPALLFRDGAFAFHLRNERLLAGLIAALVALRTKSIGMTIVVGMTALWILQSLL